MSLSSRERSARQSPGGALIGCAARFCAGWRSLHGRRLTNGQIQLPRTTREKGPTADGKDYRTVPPVANAGVEAAGARPGHLGIPDA
jgi:hypothetical protein